MLSPIEKTRTKSEALQTLGLHKFADQGEVRKAWHGFARKLHPDSDTGCADEFARVKLAYEFLSDPDNGVARQAQKTPNAVYASRPRPQTKTRITDISGDTEIACRSVLAQFATDDTPDVSIMPSDHVPCVMRRRGRRLTYIVDTPLMEGSNRVALPTGELVNRRKIMPKVMNFSSPTSGSGTIEVPDNILAELFPGADSVRIHFQGAGMDTEAAA